MADYSLDNWDAVVILEPPAPFINANSRDHYRKKAGLTKKWRATAREAAFDLLPIESDRAHITCTIRFSDNRRRDVGNLFPTAKACVDGLVDAGVLEDDDDTRVIGPDMRREYPNGTPRVTITIREIHDAA